MVTKTVDVGEVEPALSDLLRLAREGVEVLLAENNTPLTRLVPATPVAPEHVPGLHLSARRRVPGLHLGAIRTSDDFDA